MSQSDRANALSYDSRDPERVPERGQATLVMEAP